MLLSVLAAADKAVDTAGGGLAAAGAAAASLLSAHSRQGLRHAPRKRSNASHGEIMRQKGQYAMTWSQSSRHVHLFAVLTMHPQQMGCVQHVRCVSERQQSALLQKFSAQM